MGDRWTREQRSRVMSRNKGKGNKSTEVALRMRLVSHGIRGWKLHDTGVAGKPDFVFHNAKVVVFVDGCFWHGCSTHRTIPESNRDFWEKKIRGTINRDTRITTELELQGWHVIRFWEHDIRERPAFVIETIEVALLKAGFPC